MKHTLGLLSGGALLLSLTACGSAMKAPMVAEAITVPAGNQLVMMAIGSGELTYECRTKAAMPGAFEWVFTGPNAVLADKDGMPVGKYYAGPTWEANDGSKVTGKQIATAPGADYAIPLQLVKANPSTGNGAMTDISYIQRLNTMGGVAPKDSCATDNIGAKKTVKYQADYWFYKSAYTTKAW